MRFRLRKLNLRRCLIPEGHFLMGDDAGAFDEKPAHQIYVSAFEMAVLPVLNRDYAIYIKKTKTDPPAKWTDPQFSNPEQPVVGVNWHDASAYCDWLSNVSGYQIRLPTEAEWEKAARGGHRGFSYPWGNDPAASGLSGLKGPLESPRPAGRSRPNGYGLFDMVTNVYQWCLDSYDPDYYQESAEQNPQGPGYSDQHVARGGSWREENLVARCAARNRLAPYFRCDDFGLRWVRTF